MGYGATMQAVKAFTLRHTKEFLHDPLGKALNVFVYALLLSLAVWILKGAANVLYYAVAS